MTHAAYRPLLEVGPLFADAFAAAWALPAPVDVAAIVVLVVLWVPVAVLSTATLNVAAVGGPWAPLVFWPLVLGLVNLGHAGAAGGMKTFSGGEDVSAFSGGRASWLGSARGVIRWQVRTRAQISAGAVVVGWGGASVLLFCAVLGAWLLPLGAVAGGIVWQTKIRRGSVFRT